jgi:Ferritin-like
MIRLQSHLFSKLEEPGGLREVLQTALELELATIPPYLVAAYSLNGAMNLKVARLIRDIAREEMLHMVLVGNLLNAIGGSPRLDDVSVVPTYPTHLPGTIQDDLIVPLAPFSMDLVEHVFMRIEEPENPLVIPVIAAGAVDEQPRTIGQFYSRIKEIIRQDGAALFADGHPERQVPITVDDDEAIVVTDVDSALHAIEVIVGQGEGTTNSPFDAEGVEPAHYYRFKEILLGKELKPNPAIPEGFSFGPTVIAFDPDAVFPVKKNLKAAELGVDSPARALADEFNRQYTVMLQHLHAGFNGQLDRIENAANMMFAFKILATQLVQIEIAPGVHAGPTFEFVATT